MKYIASSLLIVAIFCLYSFQTFKSDFSLQSPFSFDATHAPYTKAEIDKFIREVFTEHADDLVFNSTSGRLELITGFLNRVTVGLHPGYNGKKVPMLSELKLQNKYNSLLKKDIGLNFSASDFNPLKYDFPMVSKVKMVYRVDDTDYLIIISPIQ